MASNNLSNALGQVQDLSAVAQMQFDQIPTGHFSISEYALPLSTAEMLEFGAEINPLNITATTQSSGKASDFIQPMTSPDWFLLLSIGVVVVPDAKVFALNGAAVTAPAAAATVVPQFDGVIPPTGVVTNGAGGVVTRDAASRYAQLNWGHDSWQAAWAFLHAYRMQMILTGKFMLFDELAAHVGACVAAEEWNGLGNPNLGAARYVRKVNDRATTLGNAKRFIPQTSQDNGAGVQVGAPPPLVPVGYGGPKMSGIFGGWYPTQGILLYPGMPLQVRFQRTEGDTLYHSRMTESLASESEVTWDANYSDVLAPTAAGAATGFSSAFPFKGGLFKVGIIMRGISMAPRACVDWYKGAGSLYGTDTARAIYATASAQLQNYAGLGAPPEMDEPRAIPGPRGLEVSPRGTSQPREQARGRRVLPPLARP